MLLEAGLTLASELSLPIVLQRIVDLAAQVTDARYAALAVLGPGDTIVEFVTTGISAQQRRAIGALPKGKGLLGLLIHEPAVVRVKDIAGHPMAGGFPPNHPPMRSFLGSPIRAMGRVFGTIYLADKRTEEEFSPDDEGLLVVLATQAGVAIANASLYAEIKSRERWLDALREISTHVLAGADQGSLLKSIVEHARELAAADAATIVSVSAVPGELVVSAAVGARSSELRGQTMPAEASISGGVMKSGRSLALDDVSADPRAYQPVVRLGRHGPALFVPLRVPGGATGTLMVVRLKGGQPFDESSKRLIESFADQASVVIDYGKAQADLGRLGLMEERERIAKELHDGIIQSLFAVGMGLQGTAALAVSPSTAQRIETAVEELDKVIRDLRNYIFGLRPGILADRQLDQALQVLGEEMQSRAHASVEVHVDEALAASLSARSTDIVQLTREALSNVARHAQARRAKVTLSRKGSKAALTIEDDGIGFDPKGDFPGNGMRNLRVRAAALGGTLDITSGPGRGTRLRVTFPV